MIKLNPYSAIDNKLHSGSITDSDMPPGGIPLSTAGHDEMSEARLSENQKDRNAIKN